MAPQVSLCCADTSHQHPWPACLHHPCLAPGIVRVLNHAHTHHWHRPSPRPLHICDPIISDSTAAAGSGAGFCCRCLLYKCVRDSELAGPIKGQGSKGPKLGVEASKTGLSPLQYQRHYLGSRASNMQMILLLKEADECWQTGP